MNAPANSSKKKWFLAWCAFIGYWAAVFVGLYLRYKDSPGGLMPREVFFLFVPPFVFLALNAHITGIALGKLFDADRAKDPVSFWMLTGCYWVCAVGSLVVGSGALLGFWD